MTNRTLKQQQGGKAEEAKPYTPEMSAPRGTPPPRSLPTPPSPPQEQLSLKTASTERGKDAYLNPQNCGGQPQPGPPCGTRAGCHWELGLSPSVSVLKSMERACSSAWGGRFHSECVKM